MIWKPSKRPPIWSSLSHSAKGSEWEEHEYIEEVDGKYYYPDSYEGGRHISDLKGSSKMEKSRYTDGDKDFDDKNLSENNRVGDTEFFSFERDDGRTVIIEEDKKWTLPEGVKMDAKMKKRLAAAEEEIARRRENGEKVSGEDWDKLIDEAIEGVKSKSSKGSSKSSSSKGSSKSSKGSKSGKSERQLDRERRAKNKATLAKRDLEKYRELVKERDKEYKRKTPRYIRHSFWAPTDRR